MQPSVPRLSLPVAGYFGWRQTFFAASFALCAIPTWGDDNGQPVIEEKRFRHEQAIASIRPGSPVPSSVQRARESEATEPVVLGSGSRALRDYATSMLGDHTPCAAVALMLFTPPEAARGKWERQLTHVPTSRTADLLAANASSEAVTDSAIELNQHLFGGALVLTIRVTTEPMPSDRARSEIVCKVEHDFPELINSMPIESPVPFTWSVKSHELLKLGGD